MIKFNHIRKDKNKMPIKFQSLADEFPFCVEQMGIVDGGEKAIIKFYSGRFKTFRSEEKARAFIKKNYKKLIRKGQK